MAQIQIKPDVLLQRVADEMVLLEPASGEYFTLNEVGALIVEECQSGHDNAQITQTLLETYEVSAEQAKIDTESLLEQLVVQGLAVRL